MREELLQTLMLGVLLGVGACTAQGDLTPVNGGSAGSGIATTGGTSSVGTGGAGTGNVGPVTGGTGGHNGSVSGGTGGASSGGTSAAAGRASGSGGSGVVATGGMSAVGGSGSGSGGGAGVSSGGMSASGGRSSGSGGNIAIGGSVAIGGAGSGNAGSGALGGAAGSGMAGAAGATTDPPCPEATPLTGGKQYCGSSGDGTADGSYTYNLWSDGMGMGCMTVYGVDAAFKANWMNVGDWIGRVGLSFDKSKTYDQIGTFSSDFAYTMTGITTGGFGNIGIYGWTVSPLHEYYIAENWLGKKPNFTKVGSFTIDGEGTYDIMTNQQKNQPNITGTNQDFVQYWSVRSSPRQCGHISISKHFDEWKSLGLDMGKMEEVRILVEAQNNSGTLDFSKATVVAK
jgi:hypothetical protein